MEKFDAPPPIPGDIKALIARNQREEQEKLEEADLAGKKISGPAANTAPSPDPNLPTDEKPPVETVPAQRDPQSVRPPNPRVVIQDPVKPAPTPKRIENPNEEGTKRKGKKGDG